MENQPSSRETLSRFEKLLAGLVRAKVDFAVVGGVAVILNGYHRQTNDPDILVDPSPENVRRLLDFLCGGVWEVVLDHFDPKGAHEESYFVAKNPQPVCRGGNYFDVPGNARCAVRLGLQGPSYSDSRDGFRLCLGKPKSIKP